MTETSKPRLIVVAGPNGSGKTTIICLFFAQLHKWILFYKMQFRFTNLCLVGSR
uniref:ABC transporter n=1 Tax=Candidatus Kentrum eta TaxID=2126337 RepID=A0A450UY33_9GAMM|nr:MAG: hypothetical protein BECKH772A_GA0070896_101117 [Candidatus Kentron sp. H]VFJ97450.1 MAG: hypothetical protein BECKH772B_GA0070898_101128 [Candidatus Kentron sp. H]